MRRADVIALAERVERAAGADRELDAEIAVAVTPGMFCDGGYVGFTGAGDMRPPPAYTASLDAAAALVPAGCGYQLRRSPNGRTVAYLWDGKGFWSPTVVAATPALALTAAALRAIAEEMQE
jgi:hypothetical protein